jgi:hypothetical protein
MMTVLRNKMLQNATLAALVSSVYAGTAPQNAIARGGYITFERISGMPHNHLNGANVSEQARIQVDSWGRTHDEARAIGDAVKAVLSGLRDINASTRIDMVHLLSDRDMVDGPTDGSQKAIHRVSQDYHVDFTGA